VHGRTQKIRCLCCGFPSNSLTSQVLPYSLLPDVIICTQLHFVLPLSLLACTLLFSNFSLRLACFEVLPRYHRLSNYPRLNAFVSQLNQKLADCKCMDAPKHPLSVLQLLHRPTRTHQPHQVIDSNTLLPMTLLRVWEREKW